MSTRSPETKQPSWRGAQLSPDELSARREERRAQREGQSEGQSEGQTLPKDHPWRSSSAAKETEAPRSWRSSQLSGEEREARDEERALRAGARAEKRAAQRDKASMEWERSPARRAAKRAAREGRGEGQTEAQIEVERPIRPQAKGSTEGRGPRLHEPTSPAPTERGSGRPRAREGAREGARERGEKGRRQRPPIDAQWLREAGLKYLGRFAASEAHFRRVMTRKVRQAEARVSDDPAEHARWVDEAVQCAYQCGGLNDEALARSLLNGMRRQGLSSAMIRQKLRHKGLDEAQVKRAFEEREEERDPALDQLASAARAARKKRLGPWGPSGLDYPARQKQLAALARRGFSFGVAKRVLEASLEDAEGWANSLS